MGEILTFHQPSIGKGTSMDKWRFPKSWGYPLASFESWMSMGTWGLRNAETNPGLPTGLVSGFATPHRNRIQASNKKDVSTISW